MYAIESGFPLPTGRTGDGFYESLPLSEMRVGESFLVPVEKGQSADRIRNRINGAISKIRKTHRWKFTTRIVEGGVRCWRTL